MSTDEHRSGPDDRSPETGETPVEQNVPDQNLTGEHMQVEPEASPEQPATLENPEGHEHVSGEEPVEEPVETHVALPAQRRDDPFAEVDGGEPDRNAATTTAFPTAEEDAEIRDERARRFGRPRTEGELESDPDSQTQAVPTSSEEERTSRVPLAAAGAVATLGAPGVAGGSGTVSPSSTQTMPATTTPAEEDPFKDFDDGPGSRAAAHWWSILISIVFVPVSWYLIADGGERMDFNLSNGGPFNWAGALELAGGLLCLFFVLLAARWSSVGAILTGTISALLGIAFIVFNTEAMDLVTEYQGTLVQALNQLGQNIVDHLLADARAGRLAVYGIALVMVGVVSHGARRQGRREERRKAAIGA